MKRRKLLRSLVALSTLSWIPSALQAALPGQSTRDLAFPASLVGLFDPPTLVQLGLAFREQFPLYSDRRSLAREIPENGNDIDATVTKEFERGDCVQLNGWILSRTEGRQCALYSLLS